MEKKKQPKKKDELTLEASIMQLFERSMRKQIKRECYGTGISMGFMKNEFIDQISRMELHEVINFLNSQDIKNDMISRVGEILLNLVIQEKNHRITEVKRKIRQANANRRYYEEQRKRKAVYKKANKEKFEAINAVKKKLPKEELDKLYKYFPALKDG